MAWSLFQVYPGLVHYYMPIHIIFACLGVYFAYKLRKSVVKYLYWLYVANELSYIFYHVGFFDFLTAHGIAELILSTAFIVVFYMMKKKGYKVR